jgi:hypothetical protein
MIWRDHARPIIAAVIRDNPAATEQELRRLLRQAYPYGVRELHPYKIWCSEVKKQLAAKTVADTGHSDLPLFGGER